jgi:outer membrane murein-binding lipoprotein Lpp
MSDKARVVGAIALAGCLIGLHGCDWWPPALQQQVGELETKVTTAEAEKSALLKKIADVSQAAEECKAQSDQMAKAQSDLKAQVDQLQAALADVQSKVKSKGKAVKSKSKSKK